ncbi:MAG TPA: hypothetical protein VGR63_15340 [Casimicrobiaceae bacterium]|jgi:hypothetical protein|nr:hypothetical protein [Casimicrobiaceae bacterium]
MLLLFAKGRRALPDDEPQAGVWIDLTPAQIDAALRPGESREELIALAIARELCRRRRKPRGDPDR